MRNSDAELEHDLPLCSSLDQRAKLRHPVVHLKTARCAKVFQEKLNGTKADRRQLLRMMATVDQGDMVITTAVDRLARDPTDLMALARDMKKARAGLRALAEPALDTTSEFAEIILAMLGAVTKLHRKRILEDTGRVRDHTKTQGVKFDRRPKLALLQQREAAPRIAEREPQRSVARSFSVSQSTIARLSRSEAAYG